MPLTVWAASIMVTASIPLAWWSLAGDHQTTNRASENLIGRGPTMRQTVLQRSVVERFILPLTRQIGSRLLRFTPLGWVDRRNRTLARAGLLGRISAEQVLGAKLVVPAILAAVLGLQLVNHPQPKPVMLALAAVIVSFFAPDLLIRSQADRRADAIVEVLPDMLDQVTISVEAGLGFEAALARISQGRDDPLAREFVRMLQDVRLGASRGDALTGMAERSQVDDLKTMVLSLRQADSLGAPLGRTLRGLANEMREKRKFRAEERAQRLPTTMIIPLGLCILPALFIIILGPAILSGLGGGLF